MTTPPPTVPEEVLTIASEAVRRLEIGPFVERYLPQIIHRLLDADENVEGAPLPLNKDMSFLAQSLPITNGAIHIASNRPAIDRATRWVSHDLSRRHPDPISVLSALVLIYIVHLGWQQYDDRHKQSQGARTSRGKSSREPEGKQEEWTRVMKKASPEKWQRLLGRIRRLSMNLAPEAEQSPSPTPLAVAEQPQDGPLGSGMGTDTP